MGERYDARRELGPWHPVAVRDARRRAARARARAADPRDRGARAGRGDRARRRACTSSTSARTWSAGRGCAVAGERGTRVQLRFAEMLEPDGSLYLANLRSARQLDTYVLARRRPSRSSSRASRSTASATSRSPASTSFELTGRVVHSDTPRSGEFECSERARQPALAQHPLGPARQLPLRPDRLPAARRAARLARRRPGLPPHRDAEHGRRRVHHQVGRRRPRRAVARRRLPGRRAAAGRRARRRAGVGRRGRHRAVADVAAATATCGCSSATGTRWSATWRYLLRHNPDLLWTARRGNDYGDWLSVGAQHARATCSPPPTGPTTRSSWPRSPRCSAGPNGRRTTSGCARASSPRSTAPTWARTPTSRATRRPSTCSRCTWICSPSELRPRAAERLVANIERHDGHLTTGLRRRRAAVPGAERGGLQRRRVPAAAQRDGSRPGATRSATARPRSGSAGTAGPRTPASRRR